ncbi:MAG TPA: hypothetical protein VHS05_30815 [Pyrinomonadaceae bacterium]|jgi:hypothetical protein|nr:hypothetical protein [Pyrinomonadaceae bacterium]
MSRILQNIISIAAIVVAVSGIAAAQKSDVSKLSGAWKLESRTGPETTLVISESGPEIKITETQLQNGKAVTREAIYFADGRGETNPGPNGTKQLRSTSQRNDRKLIVKFSLPQARAFNQPVTNERTDEWVIAKDGKTLKHMSSLRSSAKNGDVSTNTTASPPVMSSPLRWTETRVFKRVS